MARRLGIVVGRLERALSLCIRELPANHVEDADRALRALKQQRDRIRFAPAGYSSLFARKKIQTLELESLLSLDASLWAALEELDQVAAGWEERVKKGEMNWPGDEVKAVVFELEDTLDDRESFLRS